METPLIIIGIALLLSVLRPRSPEREVVYVPVDMTTTPQNRRGCLPFIIIAILLVLLVFGLPQSYPG